MFPDLLRDGVVARKLEQFLARRLNSSTRFAVLEAHGLVGSSMKRSATILAPFNAKAAAT